MPHKRNEKAEKFYELRPSDVTLSDEEYYIKTCNPQTGNERVFKAYMIGIAYDRYERAMYQLTDGKRIFHSGNVPYDKWWYKSQMYDNKEDCRDDAHYGCDHWEED